MVILTSTEKVAREVEGREEEEEEEERRKNERQERKKRLELQPFWSDSSLASFDK